MAFLRLSEFKSNEESKPLAVMEYIKAVNDRIFKTNELEALEDILNYNMSDEELFEFFEYYTNYNSFVIEINIYTFVRYARLNKLSLKDIIKPLSLYLKASIGEETRMGEIRASIYCCGGTYYQYRTDIDNALISLYLYSLNDVLFNDLCENKSFDLGLSKTQKFLNDDNTSIDMRHIVNWLININEIDRKTVYNLCTVIAEDNSDSIANKLLEEINKRGII